MAWDIALDDVALGLVEPTAARKVIAAALERDDEGSVSIVYDALRTLVWRLLIERRLDADLRGWFNLLKQARGAFTHKGYPGAERFGVLAELVSESIGFAEANQLDTLLRRAHVREVLVVLRQIAATRSDPVVPRAELLRRTGLRDANLSRILRTLIMHGLVERRADGRRAGFELTEAGRSAITDVPDHATQLRKQLWFDFHNSNHKKITDSSSISSEIPAKLKLSLTRSVMSDVGLHIKTGYSGSVIILGTTKVRNQSRNVIYKDTQPRAIGRFTGRSRQPLLSRRFGEANR